MKLSSTYFLRFVLFAIAAGTFVICIFALPEVWRGGSEEFPEASHVLFLVMTLLYATAVPFFISLWQALKLLRCIDENRAFSDISVKTLRNIKWCWSLIAVLYLAGVPLLLPLAEADDAPGIMLIGAAIACAPIAVAVLTAVLEKLLKSGLEIKAENDLTV